MLAGGAAQISSRHFGTLRRFSVSELAGATKDFDEDNLLGEGGFSKVYKGTLEGGKVVAVKRIKVGSLSSPCAAFFHPTLPRLCLSSPSYNPTLPLFPFLLSSHSGFPLPQIEGFGPISGAHLVPPLEVRPYLCRRHGSVSGFVSG